jgi:hypothetical protein
MEPIDHLDLEIGPYLFGPEQLRGLRIFEDFNHI